MLVYYQMLQSKRSGFRCLSFLRKENIYKCRLINSLFVDSVGKTYNMNSKFLSIICTMLSRGVLICSSRQTPALHTTEILTGISIKGERKNYVEEKAQKCQVLPLPREMILIESIVN